LEIVRLGRRCIPLLVFVLGASVAALPTLASSTPSASIKAVDVGLYGHSWQAIGAPLPGAGQAAEVGVTPGSAVSFSYPEGSSYHYPVFHRGTATPQCTGLPTTQLAGAPGWSGSCTFAQEGEYEFWCGVHHEEMRAIVYVNAAGTISSTTITSTTTSTTPTTSTSTSTGTTSTHTTTTTSTSTTSTSTSTPPPPTGTTETPPPPSTGAPPPEGQGVSGGRQGSLPTPSFSLNGNPRATIVHGSLDVAAVYAGSRLEVDLLARGAAAAHAKHRAASVRVGRLVRASVPAGRVSFAVSLDAQARRALRRLGHLALTVRLTLTPPGGPPVAATRNVVLHR
jgi:hypothetical protein